MDNIGHGIDRRDILRGPASRDSGKTLSAVIVVISAFSVVGSGWIILSFACFKILRSFRHQLILGLAISDFMRAASFLVPSAMDLAANPVEAVDKGAACQCNGFSVELFVIQSDCWVLIIALCTYLLVAEHKRWAAWVQGHRLAVFAIPWAMSLIWAGTGLGTVGYGSIGSLCWFQDEQTRLLFNFVPRWIMLLILVFVYVKLSMVLSRAHNCFGSVVGGPNTGGTVASRARRSESIDSFETPLSIAEEGSAGVYCVARRNDSKLRKLARQMAIYPLSYMLVWLLPTVVIIYHTVSHQAAPFPVQVVDLSCIVIQGLINAITYGISEPSIESWRNLLFGLRRSPPTVKRVTWDPKSSSSTTRSSSLPSLDFTADSISSSELEGDAVDQTLQDKDVAVRGEHSRVTELDRLRETMTESNVTVYRADDVITMKEALGGRRSEG